MTVDPARSTTNVTVSPGFFFATAARTSVLVPTGVPSTDRIRSPGWRCPSLGPPAVTDSTVTVSVTGSPRWRRAATTASSCDCSMSAVFSCSTCWAVSLLGYSTAVGTTATDGSSQPPTT